MRFRLPALLAGAVAAAAALAPSALAQPGSSYLVPSGNPFASNGGPAADVWAYGLRNPYRFSFDRATGNMLIGDVGADTREEVDLLARGRSGVNFGWPCREGKTTGPGGCTAAGAVDPIFDYSKAGSRAITGGYVVRDPALRGLVGRYLYADFFDGTVRSIRVDASNPDDRTTGSTTPNLSSFGEDASGRLYVTDLSGGSVYRLIPGALSGTLSRAAIAGSYSEPIYVTAPPGDGSRVFVVERAGRVKLLVNGSPAGTFLDISSNVSTDSERGLLSIAFAPDYSSSRKFYVFYTDGGGDLRIEEFRRSAGNPAAADPASRRTVMAIEHSEFGNHNGGQLQFGPDRCLYIATGDGGGNLSANAQSLGTRLGKILRIAPDPSKPCPVATSVAGDRTAPRLRTRVPRRQRVRRRKRPGPIAYARCNEACTVAMSARVRIGRRSYKLKRVTKRAAAGKRVKLRVRLTRRSSRALRRVLGSRSARKRRKATVRVALRARDRAGNRSALKRARVRVLR